MQPAPSSPDSPEVGAAFLEVLEEARRLGLTGPGSPKGHLEHALGFADACGEAKGDFLDLGSGSGLPGLVLAAIWPESRWALVDSSVKRGRFLALAVELLGLGRRVDVAIGRAEQLAHDASLRSSFGTVVARSFGPPAVTAECAAGFLRPGGLLVVSEPPGDSVDRWPRIGLDTLGLAFLARRKSGSGHSYAVLEQRSSVPERYPRRTGIPAKRPLF